MWRGQDEGLTGVAMLDRGELEQGTLEEPFLEVLWRQGFREVVTLNQVTSRLGEQGTCHLVLGTLGDNAEAERVRHGDGGLHDDPVAVLVGQVGDEGSVDLELCTGRRWMYANDE